MGNANSGRKDKFVREALLMEMKEREKASDRKGMRLLASKAWDLAEAGERWATEYIRDTLDGKPAQSVQVGGDPQNPLVLEVKRTIVPHTGNPDR